MANLQNGKAIANGKSTNKHTGKPRKRRERDLEVRLQQHYVSELCIAMEKVSAGLTAYIDKDVVGGWHAEMPAMLREFTRGTTYKLVGKYFSI